LAILIVKLLENSNMIAPQPAEIVASDFTAQGFALVPDVLRTQRCETLAATLSSLLQGAAGTRSLLQQAWCQQLATELQTHPALALDIGADAVPVQCTYFEKSQLHNWLVAWHQDLSIPVAQRVHHPDLTGWSMKEGVQYVHAPDAVLQQLVAVRLHIDVCGVDDGPLKVVARSHRLGRMDAESLQAVDKTQDATVCTIGQGGLMLMRPLLWHASGKSRGQSQRRVLHFVFGPRALPYGLQWSLAEPTP
jgi:ectoine hydroxylase-related dioxygenase (phytanoyl-CoA dioxygenase family)